MRSEGSSDASKTDCDDPIVALACQTDSDACPAECKEDSNKNDDGTVVKSGDLAVSAKAASDRKVLKSGVSDLDTLTFKTSENVEITKITLERYGYSTGGQIKGVWLEDEDGNVIAESKTLSKDKATLSIKKDYRKVDGEYKATIVVETENAGGTLGFKVTDVESTAKNLNLDDYNPYTYEVVEYKGAEVTVEVKGTKKDYNYEEGQSYEVAKLKIKAGDNAILVKGFTLYNLSGLDMKNYLDGVTVTADSEEIKATATANKTDELVVSFSKDYEIAMNKSATFAINATFADFDDYGKSVAYYVENSTKVNIVEKKNGTRATITGTDVGNKASAILHTFNGGKIKLSNTKLGNVDAAQASEGTVIAEGNITITEPLSRVTFEVPVDAGGQYIDNLYFLVNGEEYDGGTPSISGGVYTFKFKNVSIEKSGKIQFKVDIKDPSPAIPGGTIVNFPTPFGRTAFTDAKYDNSNKTVSVNDVAGSISFSKVTIQAAKAALENNLTKAVEFVTNETSRKTVFDGTYTARKGDIFLNKAYIEAPTSSEFNSGSNKTTFYVSIDGEEVATIDAFGEANEESFSNIKVKAGESVKVKVEAEVEAYGNTTSTDRVYTLILRGDDVNGNENTGKGSDTTVSMRIKAKGSVTIPSTTAAKDALLKAQNSEIAKFTIKPSNSNEGITLDELVLSGNYGGTGFNTGDLRVKVSGVEQDDPILVASGLQYSINEEIPSNGLEVVVILKGEKAGKIQLNVVSVNGKAFTNSYSKYLVDSLVKFNKQDEQSTSTTYTFTVEHFDDSNSVNRFRLYTYSGDNTTCNAGANYFKEVGDMNDGDTYTIMRGSNPVEICAVEYEVAGDSVTTTSVRIDKATYKDYFKVGGKDIAIPKA